MKKNKLLLTSLTLILALSFALAGCSSGNDSSSDQNSGHASGDQGKGDSSKQVIINLYTSESQDLVGEMMKDFESKNPGIKVNIYREGTEKVISKIEAEKSAGGIKADMLFAADIDYFHQLASNGLLESYQSPNAKNLDKKFIYEDGKYYEVRQIFNVLAYNKARVKKPLTSWKDLGRSDLKGKVAMANPNYSGAAFLTLGTLVDNDKLGWNYFQSLKDNGLKFEQSNGNLASKVTSGEYGAVSVVDFMARNSKNDGAPIDVVWPSEGAVLIPTPVAIFKSSKVKDADHKLMDYLLSKEAQKLFVKQGYIPVKTDVGVPKGAPKVSNIKIMPLDEKFLNQHRDQLKKKFSTMFGVK